MKVHACGALSLAGLSRGLVAYALAPGRGVWRERFRTAFAASLDVPADHVWIYGAGRSALHEFVASLDLEPQAEVLLPGYTCVVVPNVFAHLGLPVRYVDIAPNGFNCDWQAVAAAISAQTRVVVLPHNFGLAMEGIAQLRERFPAVVFVEDAAHAWGSCDAAGRPLGTLAQASFFSFEYAKCLTTALGGALVINDAVLRQRFAKRWQPGAAPGPRALASRLATLLYHLSVVRAPTALRRGLDGFLRAPARALGLVAGTAPGELQGQTRPVYGDALHDLFAAIGAVQAGHADQLQALRRAQTREYAEVLHDARRCRLPQVPASACLLRFPVVMADPADRAQAAAALQAIGIEPGWWFDDVVHPKGSARYGYRAGDCPHGEALAQRVLNLPLGRHAGLSPAQRLALREWAQAG